MDLCQNLDTLTLEAFVDLDYDATVGECKLPAEFESLLGRIFGKSIRQLRIIIENEESMLLPLFRWFGSCLETLRRVVIQNLTLIDSDAEYIASALSSHTFPGTELVFDACDFSSSLGTPSFVRMLVSLRNLRSVGIRESCSFSLSNAGAAIALFQTGQFPCISDGKGEALQELFKRLGKCN